MDFGFNSDASGGIFVVPILGVNECFKHPNYFDRGYSNVR
jgi:hypothetical protein